MNSNSQHLQVDNTMGAALIGVIFAAMLYGVSCVQTWYYYNRYPSDVWYIRTLVAGVWVFDSIHQGLISHTVYHYVISNYNNPLGLVDMVWSILLEVLFNAFIGLLVQSFLTLRVWRLSNKNFLLTALITALVLAGFTCSIVFTIQSLKLKTWPVLEQLKGLSMTVNVLTVVTDVLIAASLFYYLQRSRTGFKRSDTMISKLIIFTVSTGVLTSICAAASLLTILVWGHTLIYVAFYFSLGRLYSNSILATLNARKGIRGLGDDQEDISFSLQSITKTGQQSHRVAANIPANISIKIDTTHESNASARLSEEKRGRESRQDMMEVRKVEGGWSG